MSSKSWILVVITMTVALAVTYLDVRNFEESGYYNQLIQADRGAPVSTAASRYNPIR